MSRLCRIVTVWVLGSPEGGATGLLQILESLCDGRSVRDRIANRALPICDRAFDTYSESLPQPLSRDPVASVGTDPQIAYGAFALLFVVWIA